jgi:hypothetical protein
VRTLVFVVVSVISMAACSKDGGSSLNPNGPSATLPSQPINVVVEDVMPTGWAGNMFPAGRYSINIRNITPGNGTVSISSIPNRELRIDMSAFADFGHSIVLTFRKSEYPLPAWDKNAKDARLMTSIVGDRVDALWDLSFDVKRMVGSGPINGVNPVKVSVPENIKYIYGYVLAAAAPSLDPVTTRVLDRIDSQLNLNLTQ